MNEKRRQLEFFGETVAEWHAAIAGAQALEGEGRLAHEVGVAEHVLVLH